MSSTSLFYVFICLWLCGSDGVESGFKIYRSKRDIFTNLQCTDDSCIESQCRMYGAECVSEDNCKYCRCLEGINTFIISGIDQGQCKSDQDIEPKSVPSEKFWLKNYNNEKCLKVGTGRLIVGANCSTPDLETLDMFWMRTRSTGSGPAQTAQFMNVKTLECIQPTISGNLHKWVFTSTCQQTHINMRCTKAKSSNSLIFIGWWPHGISLNLMESRGHYFATTAAWKKAQWWRSSELCGSKATYTGCYRFSDGSFMKYLNQSEISSSLQIAAPIFNENDYNCEVSKRIQFSRDGQNWETTIKTSITTANNKYSRTRSLKELQLNQTELFQLFNGTLLKLFVKCGEEEHCVLFKLQSKPNYTEETGDPLKGPSEEVSESGGTDSVAIAVTVTLLMVALALALGFLVYYRRRKRAPLQQNNNNAAVNDSMSVYENPDRTYETLKDNGDEVSPNKPGGTSSNAYSYPNDNIVANPPSIEQEYTYAKETDFPRSSVGPKPETQGQINNGAVYETLYQPGQPDDDGFYNYPGNTTIPKPPASELEYTYAKDTDFPRNTGEDRKIKGDGVPATATSDDGFYHTLESEEPVPNPEQEYSYAENTDIPSHRPGTQQNNDHSTPPGNTGVYHTLEEPVPPQLPVYSTLEESADDQK